MMMVRVTADIRVEDAPPELLDAFSDQLMDALMDRDVLDPDVSGSLAKGEIAVSFLVRATSSSEGQSLGSRLLHDAIMAAGVDPVGEWGVGIPRRPNRGELPDFLGQHPDLVRRVNAELEPA